MTSVMASGSVTSFFTIERRYKYIQVNVCSTVQLLAGIIKCNGGKLDEAEDVKCVFVVYCTLESK